MGLRYLDGKTWSEVTREERVFCQRLYTKIQERGERAFVEQLNARVGLGADVNANWELVYEACFYRDHWHHRGRVGDLYSQKRTFDLGLFSDDHIIVIEAKAQQAFDREQAAVFAQDRAQLVKETGVQHVSLVALGSSRCALSPSVSACFDGRALTWLELSEWLDHDPLLRRADEVYDDGARAAHDTMTGLELVRAHAEGRSLFVGRGGGGIAGKLFANDVATGEWRTRNYEIVEGTAPPSRNWFSIDAFVRKVDESA